MDELFFKDKSMKTLEFLFSEADKNLQEILESINRNTDRSFWIFNFYISLIIFSFFKTLNNEYEYWVLLIGGIISSIIIFRNIFPETRYIRGSDLKGFDNNYFDQFTTKELDKQYLITHINSYLSSIENSKTKIKYQVKYYKLSICTILFTFFIFVIISFFLSIQCY